MSVAGRRVLLYSQRNVRTHLWEVSQTEFEDVITAVDDVELLAPPVRSTASRSGRGVGAWAQAAGELGARLGSGVRKSLHRPRRWPIDDVTVDRDHDLFFATFHFPENISVVRQLRGVRERCRVMACFLVECWSSWVARDRQYLEMLDQFDHVFLFNAASLPRIQALTRARCHFLPTGTDALRFSPWPLDADRGIDVYGYGRVSPTLHRQLCELAARDELHYAHATVKHEVAEPRAHRVQVANTLRRSRYVLAHQINYGRLEDTGDEQALSTRYFEAAAAGAVMLGSAPAAPEFAACFPWEDAVVPLAWTEPDVGAVLRALDAEPERLARIRRDSVAHSLRHHDWAHRWAAVLDAAGLAHTPALGERLARLAALGGEVAAGRWFEPSREAAATLAARALPGSDGAAFTPAAPATARQPV